MVVLTALAVAGPEEELRRFNEFLSSWPVALVFTALYVALAAFVFVRVERDLGDTGSSRRRAVVVALGVFILLVLVLPSFASQDHWVFALMRFPVFLWLFAMWLYYFVRFMTAQRSGAADPEAKERGAMLQRALEPLADERRGSPGPAVPPGADHGPPGSAAGS
jgi:heme/copper-type cytochrome/quinol oxidase subunit 2